MKNIIFILSILLIGFSFGSCKNNDVENVENIETGVFKFTYHGETYQTSYTKVGDNIVYDDETVPGYYKGLLDKNVGLATFL